MLHVLVANGAKNGEGYCDLYQIECKSHLNDERRSRINLLERGTSSWHSSSLLVISLWTTDDLSADVSNSSLQRPIE